MEGIKKKSGARSRNLPAAAGSSRVPATSVLNRSRLQMAGKVSNPGDPEEMEADSTARKVMRMSVPESSVAFVKRGNTGAFRKTEGNEDEKLSAKLRSPYIARFRAKLVSRKEEPERDELQRKSAIDEKEPEAVSRKAAEEEEPALQKKEVDELRDEPAVQRKTSEQEEEKVQRKSPEEDETLKRAAAEEETPMPRKAADEEETLPRKGESEEPEEKVRRKALDDQEKLPRQATEEPEIRREVNPEEEKVHRKEELEEQPEEATVQRKAEGTQDVSGSVQASIRSSMSGGQPLPLSVRKFMEPRFNADFSDVRVHSDDNSAKLNQQVSAKAFAVDNHIFFGRDQFQPETDEGRELIAHELTHTIQQGGAVQRSVDDAQVRQRSESKINRLGISDALDYFADRAYNIPGFRMLTIILGMNPINRSRVERSAANILRAIVEFLPGGNLITRALDAHGIFDRAGNWVERQIASLGLTWTAIRRALDRFLDSLSWSDIFDLGGVWDRAVRIFTEPINRIRATASRIYNGIIEMIKDAILRPLAVLASRTRGWDLLIAVLGRNPITGDPVARNAETLIGGFMTLIGQQEVWNNIRRANAVGRAWTWFQGALNGLIGFVRQIPTMFLSVFRSLGIRDLLDVPGAFMRVARVFGGFIGRFMSWAGSTVMQLLQIIFEVVAPGVMPYIRRAAGAFRSIIRNPIGFLRNLVRAGRLGFQRFVTNFVSHLQTSLVNWLTGTMAGTGVHIPQAFTLREILKFVLSVLGLTWQNIRRKLVRVVGEPVVRAMEAGFELIRTLVTEGPAAAWRQLLEGLSNLRDMVIEQIITFVRNGIVVQAVTRLISMLTPAGAFIQAILAIYNTVMFFIERLRTIAQVAMSFINSIASIAAGRIAAAATRVETTMAGLLTLVISFLARFVGLGRVSDAVRNLIDRVRRPIDRGLDRIVAWIVRQARRLGRFVAQAGVPQDPQRRLQLAARAAIGAARRLRGNRVTAALLNPILAAIRTRYGLTTIVPFERGGSWWVRVAINPVTEEDLRVPTEASAGGGPNYQPLISRLSSAIQMYDLFNSRDPDTVFTNMLTALRDAKTTAEQLHAQRGQGRTPQQLTADRNLLAGKLRQIQTMDPNYELVSIGEMSLTLDRTTVRMSPPINVPPFEPRDRDPAYLTEYRRQLREQQDGINAMMAYQWKTNRDRYISSGRSAAGTALQREFGARTGAGRSQGTAAPHNPDQIAGGYADPVGIPAVARVNSSIGPGWRQSGRVAAIENRVNELSAAKRQKTQMNVVLQLA